MSFLFGDEIEQAEKQAKQAQQRIDEQLVKTQAELEQKKKGLYDTRLGIIKGQGGEQWS
jgi:hypothetical protein